jgi:ectoine hydroxylase-related dioxygenase (phytanoyl-CoA dioxygenase family)
MAREQSFMLSEEQRSRFHEDGFLVVPNVLTNDQVRSLRAALRPKFKLPEEQRRPGDTEYLLFDIFSRHSELRWLLFHAPTLSVLRSLLGDDFVVLREAAAHFEQFGGWHKDTTSQEREGRMFQWDNDYLMLEVAYYLQDNSPEYGGGLDVQPGSHRKPDLFAHPPSTPSRFGRFFKRWAGDAADTAASVASVPRNAGDLVVFHFRMNHRATPRTREDAPEDRQKMAIFLACSRNNHHVKAYHDFIASRESYVYLKGGFAYPEDLLADCSLAGINLA